MSKNFPKKFISVCAGLLVIAGNVFAQTTESEFKRINFGYSQNPKTKSKPTADEKKVLDSAPSKNNQPLNVENNEEKTADSAVKNEVKNTSIAKKTFDIAKRAAASVAPTEIYKIGVGDILFISLQNAPTDSSNYFTVLNDGTIDYPLAGQMVSVNNLTSQEIEDLLKEKIKLFENPQVSVKVREHASHPITVLGLVEKAGVKFLPREAMPLYYVRAEAVVQAKANQAVIKRTNAESELIDLNDSKNDNVLIFPGDIVEFKFREDKINESAQPQFFYIGGNIISAGQKDFHPGLTLTQAIFASGGLRKSAVKKIIIRRKNAEGLLFAKPFNLKSINDGLEPDPTIEAGDTIEVGN